MTSQAPSPQSASAIVGMVLAIRSYSFSKDQSAPCAIITKHNNTQ